MSDFEFVGRNDIYNLDFTVADANGVIVDADAPPTASFRFYSDNTQLWSRPTLDLPETGVYRLTLSSVETATPGLYYVLWSYTLNTIPQLYRTDIEIPAGRTAIYSSLSDEYRGIVDAVWWKFADGFDSALGGPHLQMYAQGSFGRETLAGLLGAALGKLNTTSQPYTTYGLHPPAAAFPFEPWGPLLGTALTIEVIKHLMRSYVEQPEAVGIQQARLDRRDYLNRWQTILDIEQRSLDEQLPIYRIANMNLGYTAVVVDGGYYGRSGMIGGHPGTPRRPVPPTRPW